MDLYGRYRVTLPGEQYVWEPDDTTGTECGVIEDRLGVSFDQWVSQIIEARFAACRVLVWFLRNKAGRAELLEQVDFPIRRLDIVKVDDLDRPVRTLVRQVRDAAGVEVATRVPQTMLDGEWVDTAALPESGADTAAGPGEAAAAGPGSAAATSSSSPASDTGPVTSTF